MLLQSFPSSSATKWIPFILFLAAIYPIGLSLILFENGEIFYSSLLLLIGLGCGVAAIQPSRFWSILIINFILELVVIFTLAWTVLYQMTTVNKAMWIMISGIWLIIFWIVLRSLYRESNNDNISFNFQSLGEALDRIYIPERKTSLGQLSYQTPLLIIFLRYLGCTFCRQTLANIEKKKEELLHHGFQVVLIHMNSTEMAKELFDSYGLKHLIQISDPNRHLYRLFGVRRANFSEFINSTTVKQFFHSTILEGHRQRAINGDPLQMPGVFLVYQNQIMYAYYPKYISDQPNLSEITNLNDVSIILNSLEPAS